MKNNVAFFGASVTQQQNGYWQYFMQRNPNLNVKSFGYGSMHLNDAGICYIDTVLEFKPEYCFIDWFSTGYIKYNEDKWDEIQLYIDTIIHKFYSEGVKIVFLIFPDLTVDKKNIYEKIKNYLKNINVPFLDISESFNNINEILRDGIHTTPYGSEQYSILIDQYFKENINIITIPELYPNKTKYCDVKFKDLNITVNNQLILNGPCEIIGISQLIGPYTGLIRIDGELYNNWDRWCYYERKMVNLKFDVKNKTIIEILEDDFDRSSCEHHCNWQVKKQLRLMTAFYIGDNLSVEYCN
jgi:hypothetical protein